MNSPTAKLPEELLLFFLPLLGVSVIFDNFPYAAYLPFPDLTVAPLSAPLALVAASLLILGEGFPRGRAMALMAAFFTWGMFLTLGQGALLEQHLGQGIALPWSAKGVISLTLFAAAFVVGQGLLGNRRREEAFYWGVKVGFALQWLKVTSEFVFYPELRPDGFSSEPSNLALQAVSFYFPFFVWAAYRGIQEAKRLALAALLLAAISLSTFGWLAVGLFAGHWLFTDRGPARVRMALILAGGVASLLLILSPHFEYQYQKLDRILRHGLLSDVSSATRLAVPLVALESLVREPVNLVGIGFSHFRFHFPRHNRFQGTPADRLWQRSGPMGSTKNVFVRLLLEGGVIGFGLFAALMGHLHRHLRQKAGKPWHLFLLSVFLFSLNSDSLALLFPGVLLGLYAAHADGKPLF